MKIWHYDSRTKELIGEGEADADPLVEGEFIHPFASTAVEPPEPQEGSARIWNGEAWQSVPDYRGEIWWPVGDEFNERPVIIDSIGDPKTQGLTNIEPPSRPKPNAAVLVSPRQIRLALTQQGYRADVENYFALACHGDRDAWQFASKFARDGVVNKAMNAIGKKDEEIDALFEVAKSL